MRNDDQRLDLIILDQDEVLFPHWDGLQEALCDHMIDAIIEARGGQGHRADILQLIDKSYREHGLGTVLPARDFGLDHLLLHRDYHRRLIDGDVMPQFAARTAALGSFFDDIRKLMRDMVASGLRFTLLTHGDDYWARIIAEKLDIHDLVPFRRGVDSYGFRLKSKSADLYTDFLKDAAYTGAAQHAMLIDDRLDNLKMAKSAGLRTCWIHAKQDIPAMGFRAEHDFENLVLCLDHIRQTYKPAKAA